MSISALKEKFNSLTLESENHWDYRGNNNSERDYVHGFCTYPAMMVPKMQREMLDVCLEHLQDTSIRLLDPFAGSGTILVEGMLRGLNIVGIDINPLAILLCKAKTTILNPTTLHEKTVQLFAWITIHDKTPLYKFDGINKWFTNQAISDLSRIRAGIIAEETIEYRRFFWASFCEVVRIVSNSRDCTYKLHIKEKKDIDAYAVDAVDLFKTTKIIIKDLINPEMWGQTEQISLLTNSINKIVSPFRSKKSSFHVVAQINGQPIDTENKVFDELLSSARAKHTIKYSTGTATIVSEFKNSFFYNREVLHRVMSGEFTLSETAVRDFLQTYKKDFPNVSTYFREGVSLISEDTCKFPDIAAPIFTDKSDSNEIKKSIPIDPGIFECEIYEYSLDQKFLDYLYDNISYSRLIERDEYRDFVSRYHGIKVVRDGFVIQGFGDGDGGDWLGLSSSSKTTGYFFDLRNDSVIGCVYLTGVANSVLKETTNREGFVEDEYFRAFKSILDGSIKRINRNRKKLNDFMKRYVVDSIAFSGNPSSDVLNYKPAIEQIREDLRTVDASVAGKSAHINVALKEYKTAQGLIADAPFIPLETVSKIDEIYGYIQAASDDYQLLLSERDAIGKKLDAINLDFEKMSERLQDLFELAGLGLSVEMFTHEFDSSIRSVRQKNQQIVSNRAAQTVDNLVRHINYVTYSLDSPQVLTPRPPCNLDSAATSKVKRASWSSRCWSVKSLSSVCVLRMQKSWISFLRVRLSIILKLWRDSISVMSFTRSSRVMVSCLRTFRICSNTGLFAITFSPHWVVRTLSSVSSASAFQFSFAARTMWAH